jgi:hypothetical protein
MSEKQKVLVCVLASIERQGWVNPLLIPNLIAMSADSRYTVQIEIVIDKSPVDYARNCCVAMARERDCAWLLMLDNDQASEINPLDVLHRANGIDSTKTKDIIGLPTMQSSVDGFHTSNLFVPNLRRDNLRNDGEFMQVHRVGTGAIFLSNRVWQKLPGPWFKTVQAEADELRTPTEQTEDFYFCDLAREHGFYIWSHNRMMFHLHTVEICKLGMHVHALTQAAQNGPASGPMRFDIRPGSVRQSNPWTTQPR